MLRVPPWVRKGTIPSLNGLRALAIIAVIASHYNRAFRGSWVIGHFGVISFFVLSGFLITLLLLRERDQTGTVSLSDFYLRRALRILPAYAAFLLGMYLLQYFGILHFSSLSWIAALTYTSCFFTLTMNPHLAHSWSLSVEEHFYFLWPLLFRKYTVQNVVKGLLICITVSPFLRWILYLWDKPALDINYSTPGQMGSLATGCLLAFVVSGKVWPEAQAFFRRWAAGLMVLGMGVIGLSIGILRSHKSLHEAFADPLRAVGFGVILVGVLYLPIRSSIRKFLNWAPMNAIGVLSYSLYLWQQFFARNYHQRGGFLASMIELLVVASASYYFVEQPFLQLKARIATPSKRPQKAPEPVNSADVPEPTQIAV